MIPLSSPRSLGHIFLKKESPRRDDIVNIFSTSREALRWASDGGCGGRIGGSRIFGRVDCPPQKEETKEMHSHIHKPYLSSVELFTEAKYNRHTLTGALVVVIEFFLGFRAGGFLSNHKKSGKKHTHAIIFERARLCNISIHH